MALTDFFRRASGRASSARAWTARHERLLWAGLIAAAFVMQWPTIKGSYYRAVDTPAPPSAIEWRTDLDEALIEARRTQKQVLVDFSADWCPPCIAMKHAVWPDAAVEQVGRHPIPAHRTWAPRSRRPSPGSNRRAGSGTAARWISGISISAIAIHGSYLFATPR